MRRPPRCYDHRERAEFPVLCATCQRIRVEQRIVMKTVDALLKAGYALYVDDRDDYGTCRPAKPTTSYTEIRAELMETDDDFLCIAATNALGEVQTGKASGWIRFVYGNDGYDVISDYTTNLESVLKPIMQFADSLV